MEASLELTPMDHLQGPNWLLRGLVIVSVAIHAVLCIHFAGIYRTRAISYIEMTLKNVVQPAARTIPRPRLRPKMPEPQNQVKQIRAVARPVPRFKPLAMAPVNSNLPDTLMEGIQAPDIPQTPGVDSAAWTATPQAGLAAGDYMTTTSYLDMVRLKIESRKRYPEAAKARSIEGRVTIRFVLSSDGSIRDLAVTKGTRNSSLNMAALDAVERAAPFPRPPANLFKGDLPLELTIVFELT
ncbi:conserved hypothetical protein [Desulfosarcina cetonica]|uniref:energy transducer TonB n=1 Tax=Desulfosarcina cetonica TaxID=90730 RepID=UPI0006D19102|nr:energy transducer TonB [Desulfosarcina cetonica]VTR67120.1 conserved hypothetical protein [Desulfosarcina cetonica]